MVKSLLRKGKWVHGLRGMQSVQEKASEGLGTLGFYTECNWKPLKGFRQENSINFMIQR